MNKIVWIIDDDNGILEVTQIVLEEAGFIAKKLDSETAIDEELQKDAPNVVLLDVMISGVDGTDVAKRLKNHEKTKNVPIILMSANADIEEKAKEAGVDSYLKKPFDIFELEKIVKKYVNSE
jgi:DNA-binding response OmpR family regulator